MKNNSRSRSSLFLMELILVILFFAVAGSICVQIFVKAHLLSQSASDLNRALNLAQSAAAGLDASGGSLKDLAVQFPEGTLADIPDKNAGAEEHLTAGEISAADEGLAADESLAVDEHRSVFIVYYDSTWSPCGQEEASYILKVSGPALAQPGNLNEESVSVQQADDGGKEIYRLDLKIYNPAVREGGARHE